MLGGIVELITKTHTGSICFFGIDSTILRSNTWTDFETSLVRIGTSMVPIENRSNYVANITSSSI